MDIEQLAESVFEGMKGYIDAQIAKLRAEIVPPLPLQDVKDFIVLSVREQVAAIEPVPGPEGKPGLNGERGKDAPSLEDFVPIIEKMVAAIPVPVNGKDGEPGRDAVVPDVLPLIQAEVEKAVLMLPPAMPGTNGQDGEPGQAGRDAAQLDFVPIEEGKSYPRNTWAKYRGGIVKSFRNTDPIGENLNECGWEVMVAGIADIGALQQDERNYSIVLKMTDGSMVTHNMHFAVPLYRDVYKDGSTYRPGDCITWDGCIWIAKTDTKDRPGAPDAGWRMAVKKGRDGRDFDAPVLKKPETVKLK